ncbi:hypothetical protein K435DRAFT_853066 [Dendrothele bispora CBS 962.96]|uniref:Uncharacterized protein n=1 Tax=Dendrothele bispora (strain CBS 962.96) TaxID=1314807 RepID=A0A4S8MI66_DENBC|nr:hypothetical protein K435DRAFT_853066 [Dendrothele bispora CBS 962.96]
MEARIRMADGHSGRSPTDGFLSDNPRMNGGWDGKITRNLQIVADAAFLDWLERGK